MKESAWDKQLWQNKMEELPLEGDETAMWQNMQSLLDENMPVNPQGSGPAAPKNFPGAGTILSAIVIISAISILLFYWLKTPDTHKLKVKNKIENVGNSLQNNADKENAKDATKNTDADKALNKAAATNAADSLGTANSNKATTASDKKANKNTATAVNDANSGLNIKAKSDRNKNHTLVSGDQSARNAYLKSAGAKGKPNSRQGKQLTGFTANNSGSVSPDNTDEKLQTSGTADLFSQQTMPIDSIGTSFIADQLAHFLVNRADSELMRPFSPRLKALLQAKGSANNKVAKNGKQQSKPGKGGSGNSRFEFDLRAGLNAGKGTSVYPGITMGYFITPKAGIMIGADVMASRTYSGSYDSKTQLTYRVDTGKFGIRQSGQITISGSRKMYTIDVPVTFNYRVNQYLSVYGGPVFSIPVKTNATKPTLTKLANSNDTTRSLVAPYVSGTTISNKPDYGFTGGVRLHYNRLFISGGYMQNMQSNTISSGLGSGKTSKYHALQFGIGYQLFKPKTK